MKTDRRDFINRALVLGISGLFGGIKAEALVFKNNFYRNYSQDGTYLRDIPFTGEGNKPLNKPYGEGLQGRLSTDLSKLTEERLITPNHNFFIRTRYPDKIDEGEPWKIRLGGNIARPINLDLSDLNPMVENLGVHLMECSGNSAYRNFGLISAAEWEGVPIAKLFDYWRLQPKNSLIKFSGFDQYSSNPGGSIPGASWIFTWKQLLESRAFLATKMNGVILPKDHGFPVRLLVPGWYGCCCIKWINEISILDKDAKSTRHMREFASRTHQIGVPESALQFKPAKMGFAAMPVRIEQWIDETGYFYNIIGIQWGEGQPHKSLKISFNNNKIDLIKTYIASNSAWSLWLYKWRPEYEGRHQVGVLLESEKTNTIRLDMGYYNRAIDIRDI